jgi:hypothetical protein
MNKEFMNLVLHNISSPPLYTLPTSLAYLQKIILL